MKATFISREKNDVKFTIEFSAEEFENAQIKAYQQNKDKFQIDGFRKGKAPRTIIERHYGEGVFFEDAIDELFRENYGKALALRSFIADYKPLVHGDHSLFHLIQ